MEKNGYESLFQPGGLDFAIKAVRVSVPAEQQAGLILKLCNIVLLVVDYCKQPNQQKKINTFELAEQVRAEKVAAEEKAKLETQTPIG